LTNKNYLVKLFSLKNIIIYGRFYPYMARKNNIKSSIKEELKVENAAEAQYNVLCLDCIHDCKQKAGVAILSCPQKVKIDKQLMLFNKNGKPRKWR